MLLRLIIFLALNFSALGIGGFFTGKGVPSDWYEVLDKAPWTPPGWVFGAAWTSIMVCYAVYLALLWPSLENKKLLLALFACQWILNVSWNPVFFHFHQIGWGLIVIVALTAVVAFTLVHYFENFRTGSLLLLPYLLWLLVATSLNGYIFLKN
ncbi:sensory protein TspO [Fulvitalea axinellae]|uniref:Sensory protein TspO n=1 Tax=Fulvitalea axinellae TaxID=1182444 RepID=A0AAU9D5G6_9BACT|nr:sensory protein TspO [Fulvitalea axinellae]